MSASRSRLVVTEDRIHEGGTRLAEGARGALLPERQPGNLADPAVHEERLRRERLITEASVQQAAQRVVYLTSLAHKPWLTVAEFADYLSFGTEKAAQRFLEEHRDAIPTVRRGGRHGRRGVRMVARADVDRYMAVRREDACHG